MTCITYFQNYYDGVNYCWLMSVFCAMHANLEYLYTPQHHGLTSGHYICSRGMWVDMCVGACNSTSYIYIGHMLMQSMARCVAI